MAEKIGAQVPKQPNKGLIELICSKCESTMEELGALVFSVPRQVFAHHSKHPDLVTDKYHICVECWLALEAWIRILPK